MDEKIFKEPDIPYEHHYTYADYLNFSLEEMVEIIKGKIFKMSPAPSSFHQAISGNLFFAIKKSLLDKKCKVFAAPFDVVLPVPGKGFMESDRVVQPDITVICNPDIIKEKGCFGTPDWIIEILSPYTTKKDLQNKYDLYEESGVQEYWVIEPKNYTLEVFVLENTSYKRIRTFVQDDLVSSFTIPDLQVDLKEIFEL